MIKIVKNTFLTRYRIYNIILYYKYGIYNINSYTIKEELSFMFKSLLDKKQK
jgi:hypothetical protein